MSVPRQRAAIAEELLALHPAFPGCAPPEAVAQLLSDCMHYCARERIAFDAVVESARQLHTDETTTHCYFDE